MKNILLIILALFSTSMYAQVSSTKKQPVIGLHFFYNDFLTPQNIKANNIGHVISNNLWNKPNKMQGGFGIDYLQGIGNKIDAVGTFNGSWVDYLLPGGSLYGSSNFLLDVNAGAHIKLLTDKHVFSPFLIAKAGYSSYKSINGFSLIPGAGIQVNLFKEAFILTTIEYRAALSNSLSNQFYYSVGIATSIFKRKVVTSNPVIEKPLPTVVEEPTPPVIKDPVPVSTEPQKMPAKDIVVTVTDELTRQPLYYAVVTLLSSDGKVLSGITNADGMVIFSTIEAANYTVAGRLNKVEATKASVSQEDFNTATNQIPISITHNDPRFTLVGNTVDKTANKPVGNTMVTINNTTQSIVSFATSETSNGEFRTQLEASSDFSVVGKKASFISNIENVSTKGLNRSATLYVKLQLGLEEATVGKSIVLNKIYFETGKANLNTATSSDLKKLVQFLKDNTNTRLEIQGHTDNTGSLASNIKLSQQRANSVVQYLVKNGISKERLLANGYGPSLPIATNATAAGKARNRRVEMKVVE